MKRKLKLTTLLILATPFTNLHALDCGGLKEGEEVRLDSPGKSLHKASVQDQDGLGTCYSNTASLLLQSVLPDNPNVSYLNLALYYAQDTNRTKEEGAFYVKPTAENQNEKNLTDGGFTCETINLAKKRQDATKKNVICKSQDVALEHEFFNKEKNAYEDLDHIQNYTLLGASKYLSAYAQTFGADLSVNGKLKKREEADKFAKNLDEYIKANIDPALKEFCSTPSLDYFESSMAKAIVKTLNQFPDCLSNNAINQGIDHCKIFSDLGVLEFNEKTKTLNFEFKDEVIAPLFAFPEIIFQKNVSRKKFDENINQFITKNIKSKQPYAIMNSFLNSFSNNMLTADKNFLDRQYSYVVQGDTTTCMRNNQLAYFWHSNLFLENAKKDKYLCQYENLLETIPDLVTLAPESLISDTKSLMDFILLKETEIKYDQGIANLIANDCSPDKRLRLPEKLNCADTSTELTPEQLKNEAIFNQHVLSHRKNFMANLNNDRPLSIDYCTRYWYESGYKLHELGNDKKYDKCMESGVHGFHATAMIGYRCKNNKIQYLSQNSWGPNWKLDDPKFEIENGKIWLDEKELFENLINYGTITK